jgi:hypothetical protein
MFQPGQSGNAAGRPKGTQNSSTERVKTYYLDLLNGNLENIQEWLNQTAEADPAKALDFLLKLSPFVIPKKTESDIKIDNPLRIIIPKDDSDKK